MRKYKKPLFSKRHYEVVTNEIKLYDKAFVGIGTDSIKLFCFIMFSKDNKRFNKDKYWKALEGGDKNE